MLGFWWILVPLLLFIRRPSVNPYLSSVTSFQPQLQKRSNGVVEGDFFYFHPRLTTILIQQFSVELLHVQFSP